MKFKRNTGITLIALVVTIIVLLILAGITLSLALNSNGIFQRSKNAAAAYSEAEEAERAELDRIAGEMDEVMGIYPPLEIPEGLEKGAKIKYTPTGEFHWNAELATSYEKDSEDYNNADINLITVAEDTEEKTIDGKQNMSLTEWNVVKVDKENGEVVIMPTNTTGGFSADYSSSWGYVVLHGAQGYNNAVKLLNDACSALYGNPQKGIIARSISMEDIEPLLDATVLETAKNEYTPSYGNRHTTEYSDSRDSTGSYIKDKFFPVIYVQEENSIVNGILNSNGLGQSQQSSYIKRSENVKVGSNTYTAANGKVEPISIRPEQTMYNINAETLTTALSNKDIILPKEEQAIYWIASRCVYVDKGHCGFNVRGVLFGSLTTMGMCGSMYGVDESCPGGVIPSSYSKIWSH